MSYILFAGLLQIILSIAFILSDNHKSKADYLLVMLLCCIGIHLGAKFYIFNVIDNATVSFRMHTAIQLAYGPLLYLYSRKKCAANFTPSSLWYLFVPVIVAITLYGFTSLLIARYPEPGTTILRYYNQAAFLPIVASHIIYGIITPSANVKMLVLLKGLFIAMGLTEIVLFTVGNSHPELNPYIRSLLYVLLGAIPVIIVWSKQAALQKSKTVLKSESVKVPEERKPLLDDNRHKEIFDRLETVLQEQMLYKDEDLTLEKLATACGINKHHISETLNIYASKPFYQYINEYRIKEVLHLLDNSPKKVRLLNVAYDSGFKTKASFNQYFKKITGTTPSAYLKQKAA